ncbi:MAG TPA: superoxide dismutase [Steroidobacteraceae bacterium]|nr:superoxide dismutase [Steroidobacteraceae bacterium]
MRIEPPQLPYGFGALQPTISRAALQLHFERHHVPCYERLLGQIRGTELEGYSLSAVVRASSRIGDRALFHNATLVWNHDFYWKSMQGTGFTQPEGLVAMAIQRTYGGFGAFAARLRRAALGRLANGWLWVTWRAGRVHVLVTGEADTPIVRGHVPLLAIDLWEHAYYLDYQDQKGLYVDLLLENVLNWPFAESRLRRVVGAARSALNLARAGLTGVWPTGPTH